MAMIRCSSCNRLTSDSDTKCVYCGAKISNTIQCPKCNSKDTKVVIKDAYTVNPLHRLIRHFTGSSVDITYVCNNCGKKYKLK